LNRTRRRTAQEACPELLTVRPVIDPLTRGSDPLAGVDRGCVTHKRDEIAMAAGLDPEHAKAVLGIMERHPLHDPGEHIMVRFGGRRRCSHGSDYCQQVCLVPAGDKMGRGWLSITS